MTSATGIRGPQGASATPLRRRRIRLDIQALRAIAVALVVAYHLDPALIPGGFIGVDVFFVISGFLITSHLIREATLSGRVRLGAFWAARARRILPASLVAIGVTIALTVWLMPATFYGELRRQALASIFYVQNWILASDAVDYSAAENDATPFQHFWSLSVEEQFYIFWPLLVLVGLWFVTRTAVTGSTDTRDARLRKVLILLFSLVVLTSLTYSVVAVEGGNLDAYFITTTRIWELGAGGLLAAVGGLRLSVGWRYSLIYLGLAAIALSAILLNNETPFPGLAAMPVIAGTVAVIFAGTPGPGFDDVALTRSDPWVFVSNRGFVRWLGDRSYSLYLWHFPVIILWPYATGASVTGMHLIGMLILSLILADLSYRFVEQPVRRARSFTRSTPRTLITSLLVMLLIAASTWVYPAAESRVTDNWNALSNDSEELSEQGAQAVADGELSAFTTDDAMITPSPTSAKKNTPTGFRGHRCVARQLDETTPHCEKGVTDSEVSVALVGDSHARMWGDAVAAAANENGWKLDTYIRVSCPFTSTPKVLEAQGSLHCTEPNEAVLDALLADPPDVLVTTWRFNTNFATDGLPDGAEAAGFANYWNALEDAGTSVLVIRGIPEHEQDIPSCVASNYEDPEACSAPRDDATQYGMDVLQEALKMAPQTEVADFTDRFCDADSCKAVIGNMLVYRDKHHVTAVYAKTLVPALAHEIEAAMPAGEG